MEGSLVYTKFCAVLQRSRAKNDKISTSDMTVDTLFLFTAKLVREWEFILRIWHGKNDLIPVHLENNIFNFYLNREVK